MIQKTEYAKHHVIYALKIIASQIQEYEPYIWGASDIAEFGVKEGQSMRVIVDNCKALKVNVNKIWGFDSFEGFPENNENLHDWRAGENRVDFNNMEKIEGVEYVKGWFSELSAKNLDIRPLSLVHIDCDLYGSTIDALEYCLSNGLILEGTLIAFDEFKCSNDLWSVGEAKAWKELSEKYKIESIELFRNIFCNPNDPLEWWQNTFAINSIGKINKCTLLES